MAKTTQEGRLLKITTKLPDNELLINRFQCEEAISELYEINVELLRDEPDEDVFRFTPVDVNEILGQKGIVQVRQEDGGERFFAGMFSSFRQVGRDRKFSKYEAVIVPHVWKLTKTFQSRIFQHITVPDILEKVFEGLEVKFELQREYKKRNYCVQHQEFDFDFASRLMEEEGIYYYFEHTAETERMVLRDDYKSPEDCPTKSEVGIFDTHVESEGLQESAVSDIFINYDLRSGKRSYRDHHFQIPTKKLETETTSRLSVGGNQEMEVYTYPGGYARKVDGVDSGGGNQQQELEHIFDDNKNLAANEMLAVDSGYRVVHGESTCCTFTSGYRFKLINHPNREVNGNYVITSVSHSATQQPGYIVGDEATEGYSNRFSSIPHGSGHPEFRPEQKTPKPVITGVQSAYVVGPDGEEIYTDEYGRVKVQFHWDRDGENDPASSCWLRVKQAWAGNRWGMMFIPRVGMEVIVSFLNGDPDRPMVTGCVYNPQTMPPYALPDEKTVSTIKSDSSKGGRGFNELRFEDKKGSEQIFMHGQKDLDMRIRNSRRELIGGNRHLVVQGEKREHIKDDVHKIVEGDNFEEYQGYHDRSIEGSKAELISEDSLQFVGGKKELDVVGNNISYTGGSQTIQANGSLVLESASAISLKVGANFITISQAGVMIQGTTVLINSGGMAMPSLPAPFSMAAVPEKAEIADNANPGERTEKYKQKKKKHKPKDPKNKDKRSFIAIKLVDEDNNPIPRERYRVTLPDGETIAEGNTDSEGKARVTNIDPGTCKVTFPNLDKEAWDEK